MAAAGAGKVAKAAGAAVKPIFSRDLGEAKRRVRELYRAWYREVPNAGENGTTGNYSCMEAADTHHEVFP
uniref:NADH dehydrogenase [ubiquinone] 1 alpha subcomplex subunit 6 n=1 Tax=Gopherus agassizii TaxID=38772 RepID=A0A452GWV6_9SAUR